jgi:transcriptional regulator with XRE-family HTH domain
VIRRREKTEWERAMGIRLRELRLRQGLTQEGLARRIDVSTNTIRHWERGDRTMNADRFVRLAQALDVTLYELAGIPPPRRKKK